MKTLNENNSNVRIINFIIIIIISFIRLQNLQIKTSFGANF